MDKLKIQQLSSLLAKQFPESKWLVEKLVPESGLVLLSAAPASFKTWLALEISLCVADGKSLFNTFPTAKGNVLICDEESGERMLQDRYKKLGAKITDDPQDEKQIYYLSRLGRQVDDNYIKELIAECLKNNIKLVVFDSLVRFHNARENDASEMAKVLNLFKTLNDNGIAALVLHHNRKSSGVIIGSGEMMRGSSDILASCDIHLSVNRRERKITISQTKNRYMEEIKPFSVRLQIIDEEKSSFEFLGEEIAKNNYSDEELNKILTQQIENNPGINKRQLISLISANNNISHNRISSAINDLINDEEIITKQGIKNSTQLFIKNSVV